MFAAAIAVALAFWGPPPCTTAFHVAALKPNILGEAWVYGNGVCEVKIAAREWQFWQLCAVAVHEVGHVHGRSHSENRFDVMYPLLWRPADACRGKRPPKFRRGAVIRLP